MADYEKTIRGGQEELDVFAEKYYGNVKRTVSLYVGKDCDDIAQTVWVKIIEKRHLLANVSNIDNWLFM